MPMVIDSEGTLKLMRTLYMNLMKRLRRTSPGANLDVVRQAAHLAERAHHGQVRASGEPYVTHSLNVALILANLGLDPVTCAAGILHDTLEDTAVTREELRAQFGDDIARVVDGVTKINKLSFHDDRKTLETKQAQNISKMLVATAQDLRVIMIKLADRLHNMRTLEYLVPAQRERISRETLDIYAPMAHRLGISSWKWELEDHAFHHLEPESYKEVARMVAMKRREREAYLTETVSQIERGLKESEIRAQVIGRPKHLYSIYEKMQNQGKDFAQVFDVLGIRIITRSDAECYNALGIVHSLWTPIPGRLKDYIAMPKLNMYQAIHTTVMRENGRPMEVQIRSEEMDRVAREGIAAHWRYKEGGREGGKEAGKTADDKLDSQLAWLRKMYDWLKDAGGQDGMMDTMRREFRLTFIYVFTPKGQVKELAQGATPLDFAYLIHSHVGHHCIGARVNGRMVTLRYNLQTGDVVEILTSKNQEPHRDWLDVVVTGRARTRIRQRLREIGELAPIEEPKPVEIKPRAHVPGRMPAKHAEVREVDEATRQKLIRIDGIKGMAVQFAKCCNPMPGHRIVGYVTKTPGLSVHRADCASFQRSAKDERRILQAAWEGEGSFTAKVRVVTRHRPNLLADVTNVLRPLNIDITSASFEKTAPDRYHFDFSFVTPDHHTIEGVVAAVRTVPGVFEASQLDVKERQTAAMKDAG